MLNLYYNSVFKLSEVLKFKFTVRMIASRCTINIHTGKKLSGKSREEILEAILRLFRDKFEVVAVQQCMDVVRVTFGSEEAAVEALKEKGVRLLGIWCRIDGGPPTTIVHLFDFPHEEDEAAITTLFSGYGLVKGVRRQRYITRPEVFTGTRLIDLVVERTPPRMVSIQGFVCRVWYRGQPVICNICGKEGHKSMSCPDKNKCRLCGSEGHLARSCPTPWGNRVADNPAPPLEQATADTDAAGAAAAEAVAADSNVETAASCTGETPAASGSNNAASNVGETLPSGNASVADAQKDSSGPGQIDSDPINEFTSPETQESSSQGSESISQFSGESQSILCNAYGSVINQSNGGDGVVVSDEGQAPSLSGGTQDEAENMDSSVSLKRTRENEFAVPARPSRHRSRSGDSRKKSRGDSLRGGSLSPSPSRGKHSGLPRVASASPRRS